MWEFKYKLNKTFFKLSKDNLEEKVDFTEESLPIALRINIFIDNCVPPLALN